MLKLNDAIKAGIYGVPAEDTTEEKAIAALKTVSPSLTDAELKIVLADAIVAGVYVKDTDEPKPLRKARDFGGTNG